MAEQPCPPDGHCWHWDRPELGERSVDRCCTCGTERASGGVVKGDPSQPVLGHGGPPDYVVPRAEPTIQLGEPIDPDDVEPMCPRRFARLCVDVASPIMSIDYSANRVALIWPDDSDRTVASCEVLVGIVERINRDAGEIEDLAGTNDILRTDLTLRDAEVAGLSAENDRLRGLLREAVEEIRAYAPESPTLAYFAREGNLA